MSRQQLTGKGLACRKLSLLQQLLGMQLWPAGQRERMTVRALLNVRWTVTYCLHRQLSKLPKELQG